MHDLVLRLEQATNDFALQLLDVFDYRAVALLCLALLVVLGLVSTTFRRRLPSAEETLKALLAIASGLTCVPIACVFLLTKPPAIEKLSEDTRTIVGLICVVMIGYLSVAELRGVLFRRTASPDGAKR